MNFITFLKKDMPQGNTFLFLVLCLFFPAGVLWAADTKPGDPGNDTIRLDEVAVSVLPFQAKLPGVGRSRVHPESRETGPAKPGEHH